MKQNFLILLAAMLLISVGAFAQNGNNEPLKGDVNGDGKVDMADVTMLIDIILGRSGTEPVNPPEEPTYHWYVGTTKPTAVDNPTVWRTTNDDAGFTIQPNISSSDKIWVAYPDSWTLEITDIDGYGVAEDWISANDQPNINNYIVKRFTSDGETSSWTFEFTK